MGPPFELQGTYVVPSYGLQYDPEDRKLGVSRSRSTLLAKNPYLLDNVLN
jgi:hypothetical protein